MFFQCNAVPKVQITADIYFLYYVSGNVLSALHILIYLTLLRTVTIIFFYCHPHFRDDETDAWKDQIYRQSHNNSWEQLITV